mmetsp:Transcript_29034/g.78565  ORF Transcript_29034/g.78565 Transcript_29034/m.78565 type:complete len:531 (+) Transcript_29034:429-2021(+)|eukprot:CAMPEP_0172373314 /NCGR_PEP_ID=MMETSP1060-20121228/51137_1 /TAXON_ID=37318 /ORGANISM="Pseudo-nitzschia pungens, Strain cf. cingulata" /LENGTH=530 /DNA_ID=CAMNT_0013099613 /DNA_START=350 /DNA_END=1942 /DNA_ORIENTATION=+
MGQCASQLSTVVENVRKAKDSKLPKRVSAQQSLIDRRISRLSSIKLSLIPDEFKDVPSSKFQLKERKFQGSFKAASEGKKDQRMGTSIEHGIRKFKKYPNLYYAMFFPTEMKEWPENEQQFVYLYRAGTEGFKPNGVSQNAPVTLLTHEYQPLRPFKNNELPKRFRDKYTDTILSKYNGKKLHSKNNFPLLPGRGMGFCDEPHIKLIGEVDPSDIEQGQVGNCWLLSGIASLAEYDEAIERLFRKTKNFHALPRDSVNKYTVTLYDLETWKEVDIVVDERLCARADGTRRPLGAKASQDCELWVSYLEKAIAAHCGGWDNIDGGHCTHAWSLLTGVKEQYIIQLKPETGKWVCLARYNTKQKEWVKHGNSPSDGEQGMWQVPWPGVGRKGKGGKKGLSEKMLFRKICQWDRANYLIGASSKGASDKHSTDGIVDNHAYSVVDCRVDVAGTGIDMIQVRNPWGYGESTKGKFRHKGPGWKKHPQIRKELKPIFGDNDGLFWMTRQEFFKYYDSVYVGASNIKQFLNKGNGQ